MRRHGPIAIIIAAFLIVGALYALLTPEWQSPDEPAHYNYISQLAEGQLPIIEAGDYNQEYQGTVISSKFDPRFSVEPFRYEDYQPPLYYLLQTPVYLIADANLQALRLTSVVLGAGVVLLTYLAAYKVFKGQVWLALIASAFVAFLPQHVAMLSAVNNDSLAELLIAGILLLLITIVLSDPDETVGSGSRGGRKWMWLLLGLLLGLGLVTKVTVYILIPVITLVMVWYYRGRWLEFRRAAFLVFGPALLMGLIWWIRNIIVYESFDPLGTIAHNAVVVGQPRTADWIESFGLTYVLRNFAQTTFQSFWGQFGWMGVPMPDWVYLPLALFSLLILSGCFLYILSSWIRQIPVSDQHRSLRISTLVLVILTTLLALSILAYIGYNLTFVQHQGRYLFPALIPISIAVAIGLAALAAPFSKRWPGIVYVLPLALAVALIGLDIIALFRFIIPALG